MLPYLLRVLLEYGLRFSTGWFVSMLVFVSVRFWPQLRKEKKEKKNGQQFTPYFLFSDIITLLASVVAFKIHRRWSLFHVRRV